MRGGSSVGIGVAGTKVGVTSSVAVDVGGRGVEVAEECGVSVGVDVPGAQAARVSVSSTMIVLVFTMSPAAFVPPCEC